MYTNQHKLIAIFAINKHIEKSSFNTYTAAAVPLIGRVVTQLSDMVMAPGLITGIEPIHSLYSVIQLSTLLITDVFNFILTYVGKYRQFSCSHQLY